MGKLLILNRIKEEKKFHTDLELAEFLGIKQSTLASWRKRNTLDYELIIAKCDNIDLNWLITGKGNMYKNDGNVFEMANEIEELRNDIKVLTKYIKVPNVVNMVAEDKTDYKKS